MNSQIYGGPGFESVSLCPRQIEQLRRCEIIKEQEVKALCVKARYDNVLTWPQVVNIVLVSLMQRNLHRREQCPENRSTSYCKLLSDLFPIKFHLLCRYVGTSMVNIMT